MTLALFDLDNTLLAGDSDHAWGEFMVQQGLVDGEHFRAQNDAFYLAYQRGELDIHAYLAFALEPLTRFSLDELHALHSKFMRSHIDTLWLPEAEQLIRHHREQGHTLVIITATNRFVTAPIAARLGIDTLLATDPELAEDRYTGRIVGTPCFREGKVRKLQEWLLDAGHSLAGSYFYSDSINDLPLLETVQHAVAVDPDERLRAEATRRGWRVISLRGRP